MTRAELSGVMTEALPARTIVIVLQYGDHAPSRLLASLADEGIAPADVVVVQNPRRRGDVLARPEPAGTVIRLGTNRGYASAMNAGLREARRCGAEFVLLLTQDVSFAAGAIRSLATRLTHSSFGLIGPVLQTHDGELFSAGGLFLGRGHAAHVMTRPPPDRGLQRVDWIDGAVMYGRMSAFVEVDGFAESFFLYYEDSELCLRLAATPWRVALATDVTFQQSSAATSRPGLFSFCMTRNGLEFAYRHSGPPGIAAGLRAALRRVRRREPRASVAEVVGTVVGIAYFTGRRWGPPPGWLPGVGEYVAPGRSRTPRSPTRLRLD